MFRTTRVRGSAATDHKDVQSVDFDDFSLRSRTQSAITHAVTVAARQYSISLNVRCCQTDIGVALAATVGPLFTQISVAILD